jgi:hypothetical protein
MEKCLQISITTQITEFTNVKIGRLDMSLDLRTKVVIYIYYSTVSLSHGKRFRVCLEKDQSVI